MEKVWGCLSLSLTLLVWILSIPRLGLVTDVLGYTPPWMFAMLVAGCIAGIIAISQDRGWWIAVAVGGFTALVMLFVNNV